MHTPDKHLVKEIGFHFLKHFYSNYTYVSNYAYDCIVTLIHE